MDSMTNETDSFVSERVRTRTLESYGALLSDGGLTESRRERSPSDNPCEESLIQKEKLMEKRRKKKRSLRVELKNGDAIIWLD